MRGERALVALSTAATAERVHVDAVIGGLAQVGHRLTRGADRVGEASA